MQIQFLQGSFIVGFWWFTWKEARWEIIHETWGIAHGMVSLSKACHIKRQLSLKDDSTQGVSWWLELVKIARKDFEVLSKGEGQAMAWRPRNLARVKKKVLAFSWGTNQTLMVTLKWRIKCSEEIVGSDLIHLKLILIHWMESSHMLNMAMLKEKNQSWHNWHPHLMKIESYGIWFEGNQLKRFKFLSHLILSK